MDEAPGIWGITPVESEQREQSGKDDAGLRWLPDRRMKNILRMQ